MPTPSASSLHRVALLCFGGLGDVLLFSPVIAELKAWIPHLHITLFVEDRSETAAKLIDDVDSIHTVAVQSVKRQKVFNSLQKELKKRHYDALISTGQSPYLALMARGTKTPYRVGYGANWLARLLWTQWAPLHANRYASEMHLALSEAFLRPIVGNEYHRKTLAIPSVKPLTETIQTRIDTLLKEQERLANHPHSS